MNDADWYFDNITEGVIYGNINDKPDMVVLMRNLKRNTIIRKYANDKNAPFDALPAVLAVLSISRWVQTAGWFWSRPVMPRPLSAGLKACAEGPVPE